MEKNLFFIDELMFFMQNKLTRMTFGQEMKARQSLQPTSGRSITPPLRFNRNSNGGSIMFPARNDYPKNLVDTGKYLLDNFYVCD